MHSVLIYSITENWGTKIITFLRDIMALPTFWSAFSASVVWSMKLNYWMGQTANSFLKVAENSQVLLWKCDVNKPLSYNTLSFLISSMTGYLPVITEQSQISKSVFHSLFSLFHSQRKSQFLCEILYTILHKIFPLANFGNSQDSLCFCAYWIIHA